MYGKSLTLDQTAGRLRWSRIMRFCGAAALIVLESVLLAAEKHGFLRPPTS
jgi:hypothetical protein